MKKKILVVSQHFWPESFRINDICDGFVENDIEVEVLCGLPNYPSGTLTEGYGVFKNRRQLYNNIKIRRALEIPRGNNSNLRIFLNYISFPIFSLFHLPYLVTQKYDKIFLYQTSPVYMSLVGILLGKIKRIETIIYVLDLWPENLFSVLKLKNHFLTNVARVTSNWYYNNVDKLIAMSSKLKDVLKERTSLADDKIAIIPQYCEKAYEENVYDEVLSERFKDTFNIVFTGNISPAQSFETILEAAKRIWDDNIRDIRFIIVGDGMSKHWLIESVQKIGLTDIFVFEGFKPIGDIPKYTMIADALIACIVKSDLLECTIPAKVTSYFAAGRPILLSMDGEARELVNTVNCGYAGAAEDSNALYEGIKKLYSLSEDEREDMGSRAKKYHFDFLERSIILNRLLSFIFQ